MKIVQHNVICFRKLVDDCFKHGFQEWPHVHDCRQLVAQTLNKLIELGLEN
jgi:hypothetical protein